MRKIVAALALVSALLFIAAGRITLVDLTAANPFIDYRQTSPLVELVIDFISPAENNTLFNSSKVTIGFNASLDSTSAWITSAYYKTSWQKENITLYRRSVEGHDPYMNEYTRYLSLTGIPDGNQTVTVTVKGEGAYSQNAVYYYFFSNVSSTINFAVDTTSPIVSVLDLKNRTYAEFEVPLNFTVNEQISKASYVLDGHGNVTLYGNTTLTELSNGVHNVTVHAWDIAGNGGSSETVNFTIGKPELSAPFPTLPVLAFSAAAIVAGAGLLIYFKRRKKTPK